MKCNTPNCNNERDNYILGNDGHVSVKCKECRELRYAEKLAHKKKMQKRVSKEFKYFNWELHLNLKEVA